MVSAQVAAAAAEAEAAVQARSHLYDLHGDRTHDIPKEYRLLVCICLYLSVLNKAIEETVGELLTPENSDTSILRPNSYQEIESWFRKRIAFIRAKAASTNQEGQYIEFFRSHIHGLGDSAKTRSYQETRDPIHRANPPGGVQPGGEGGG